MSKHRFRVYNAQAGDHVAVIEMDDSLLAPEAGILDHKSGTLRPLRNGGMYTLLPIDDHKVATLKRVKEVYENITTKPAKHFSTHISRMDDMLGAVGLLFGEVEYTVVENKQDMENILNPPRDPDFEHKKVKYNVLQDIMNAIGAESEGEEHQCGPGCDHDE